MDCEGNGSPMDVTNKNITLSGEEFQIEHTLSWQLVSQKRCCISIHKKSHLEHDDTLVGKYVKGSRNDGDVIFCSFAINDFPTKPSMLGPCCLTTIILMMEMKRSRSVRTKSMTMV